MAYVDLGKYQFTTGADYTGLNSGNLTSVLQTSPIRIPYFELYRLLINTSQVPSVGTIPALVQKSPMAVGASLTALDITMPADVTKGNLVVVVTGSGATGDNPVPSAVELGGSADHFGSSAVAAAGTYSSNGGVSTIWADPDAQEASKAIAVTLGSGSGTPLVIGQGYEISGCLTTSSATACVDDTCYGTSGSVTSFTTPYPATSTANNDFAVGTGFAAGDVSSFSFTGLSANTTASPVSKFGTLYGGGVGNWQAVGVAGTSIYESVTTTLANYMSAALAMFLPSATPATQAAFPFTVAIDGVTWDQEETTAGVGYTYNIGQSPLYLNTGQTIQILWDLAAAQYQSYSQQFNITGWFRYDPAVQP